MKRNLLIILLATISIASLGYGYVQKQRADEQRALAALHERLAEQFRIHAEQAQAQTHAALAEAARQKQLVDEMMLVDN